MRGDSIFSPRLLIVWIAAIAATFAASLYFMGSTDEGVDRVGPSTFSRSAIGYEGVAEVLQRLDIPVVKSRYNSLGKMTPGSVLVIADGKDPAHAVASPHGPPRAAEMDRPAEPEKIGMAR
jgi:hypothetical protein